MIKGFIGFKEAKIPFVMENYRMELFTDSNILKVFLKEHNFKKSCLLHGQYFADGIQGQIATFLVDYSLGNTCYLRCYIIGIIASNGCFDSIGFQSPFLDDIFRYKYEYLDLARKGVNLALAPKVVYTIPFSMNDRCYELNYRIGQDTRLGLLEDFDKKGEVMLPLHTANIQECYDLSIVLYRLAMFMSSDPEVPFRQITLYKGGLKKGWFYCPLVSEKAKSWHDGLFHDFDIMKYIPRILSNIAIDSGNSITRSVPLGHLGNNDTMFSPQRFLEQVMSFEYLFDKLEAKKAQDRHFPLKSKLQYMLDKFPQLLQKARWSSDEASEKIKETRRKITHGYAYFYDFRDGFDMQYLILILDKLINDMSLFWIGFSKQEIEEYPVLIL